MTLMQELHGCAYRDNLYARALARILELEADCRAYEKTLQVIAASPGGEAETPKVTP